MKYEYKIKLDCSACGAKTELTEGLQADQSSKSELIQKYKNYECVGCGGKLQIDEIERIEVENDKIKDKVKL